MSVVTLDPTEVPEQEVSPERLKIRAELNRRSMLRAARAIHDNYASDHAIERDARREVLLDGTVTYRDAKARRAMREQAIARRRDILRKLAAPMTGSEILGACQHACLAAKVSPESAFDVAQDLAVVVMRRHGSEPLSCDVSAGWLKQWAQRLAQRESERRERTTGRSAAAEQLSDWKDADARAAAELTAQNGGDPVWCIAAGVAAKDVKRDSADAATIALRLRPMLTYLQTDAVRIAVSEVRAAMPGKTRVGFHAACKILRKRFHTAESVRLAVRPDLYAAELLADRAIHYEQRTAAITSRGSAPAITCARGGCARHGLAAYRDGSCAHA